MKWVLVFAGLAGALAVGIGAYAAHGMAASYETVDIERVRTAVQYQFWHTLALVGVYAIDGHHRDDGDALNSKWAPRLLGISALSFIVGILMFCGSLYGLTFGRLGFLTHIATVGGTALILGWLCLAGVGLATVPNNR